MKIDRCPVCGQRHKRSSEQNRLYWALMHEIADQVKPKNIQYSPQSWAEYFKQRFIGIDEVQMPNGKTLYIPRSTTDLSVDEFSDYIIKIEAWASEHFVIFNKDEYGNVSY